MRDIILKALNTLGQHCYVMETDGGWIISLVNKSLFEDPTKYDIVIARIDGHLKSAGTGFPVMIIYKLYIYESPLAQFCVEATMHTKRADYADGIHTTYLEASDAYVFLRQVDSEYLMLQGERPRYEAMVINANMGGFDLAVLNQDLYIEIEYSGFFVHNFKAAPTTNRVGSETVWSIVFDSSDDT